MTLTAAQRWRKTLLWLHRNFPSEHGKVVLKTHPLKKVHGFTTFSDNIKSFYVHINRDKSLSLRLDTVIHEWAHVLTWFGAGQDDDHSAEWGIAYARIYRAWVDWNYGRPGPPEEDVDE
jgi:hypothetical protein